MYVYIYINLNIYIYYIIYVNIIIYKLCITYFAMYCPTVLLCEAQLSRTLELARGALDVRSARGRSGTATTSRGHKNPFDLKSLRGRDQFSFKKGVTSRTIIRSSWHEIQICGRIALQIRLMQGI